MAAFWDHIYKEQKTQFTEHLTTTEGNDQPESSNDSSPLVRITIFYNFLSRIDESDDIEGQTMLLVR